MKTQALSQLRLPIFSGLEREVIRLGIRDGEQARVDPWAPDLTMRGKPAPGQPLPNAALEALRAWSELTRALLSSGREAPTTMLVDAGYCAAQIAEARRLVAAAAATDEEHKP